MVSINLFADDSKITLYISDVKYRDAKIEKLEREINRTNSFDALKLYDGDKSNPLYSYYEFLAYVDDRGNSKTNKNLLDLAETGLSAAKMNLGVNFLSGQYDLNKDYEKAFQWFKKAADENNEPAAMIMVATFLRGGFGHKENIEEAWHYIQTAKSIGDGRAYAYSAISCSELKVVNTHPNIKCDVISDFKKAISLGYEKSKMDLVSYKIFFSPNKEQTKEEGFRELVELGNEGNANAQTLIGQLYQHGHDDVVEQNREMAIYWYKKASKQEAPEAQFNLARLLIKGLDSHEELQVVEDLIINAASSGRSEYIDYLLKFYKNYSRIKPEYIERIEHIKKELNL